MLEKILEYMLEPQNQDLSKYTAHTKAVLYIDIIIHYVLKPELKKKVFLAIFASN